MAPRQRTKWPKKNHWKDQSAYIAPVGNGSGPEPKIPKKRTEAEIANDKIEAEKWEKDKAINHKEEVLPNPEKVQKDEIEERLKYWPWEGLPPNLLTSAPHRLNLRYDSFGLPEAEQTSGLLKLLNVQDVGNIIVPMIVPLHSNACAFAATSRRSWEIISRYINYWDTTTGWFNNCEKPRGTINTGGVFGRPEGVSEVLIVTPIRGDPRNPLAVWPKRERMYTDQLNNTYKLCQAIYNFAENFRILQLHRVPWITADLLALLVPKMTHLQTLGLYKCPLIHLAHTLPLLDIVQAERLPGKAISFDFFPRYHAGPIHMAELAEFHTGNYGVTWDTWKGNSVLAIWALMARILPRAVSLGVDLIGKDKMFRKWLDMTPCVNIDAILAALMGDTLDPKLFIATVDYFNYRGSVRTLMTPVENKPEGYEWMLKKYLCTQCETSPMGIFFFYNDIRVARNEGVLNQASSDIRCLGCKLANHLDMEHDHHKSLKNKLMQLWLTEVDGETKIDTIDNVFNNYHGKKIQLEAHLLENRRQKFIKRFNFDRESEERQNPPPNTAYPEKDLSPRYQDKINLLRSKTTTSTMYGNLDIIDKQHRLYGHGRGCQ